ncbi:hypothetical protein [Streptomyces coeruleofuscus]|uniref:UmuC domain-containing protein n=1 Tax=Streptomyces coeruleofuscus TaxID=66879 RepID=A0ABN3IXZ8_9ACTN
MHVRCPDRLPEEVYRLVLDQLAELSPLVQALPPSTALVEPKGALRYHGSDARHLGEALLVRTLSRLGVDVRIGPTIPVAATASAQIDPPGGVLAVDPGQVDAWLAPLPVDVLRGIGPRQADTLRESGIHSVALLAVVPAATACWAAARAAWPPTGPRRRPAPRRPPRPARVRPGGVPCAVRR